MRLALACNGLVSASHGGRHPLRNVTGVNSNKDEDKHHLALTALVRPRYFLSRSDAEGNVYVEPVSGRLGRVTTIGVTSVVDALDAPAVVDGHVPAAGAVSLGWVARQLAKGAASLAESNGALTLSTSSAHVEILERFWGSGPSVFHIEDGRVTVRTMGGVLLAPTSGQTARLVPVRDAARGVATTDGVCAEVAGPTSTREGAVAFMRLVIVMLPTCVTATSRRMRVDEPEQTSAASLVHTPWGPLTVTAARDPDPQEVAWQVRIPRLVSPNRESRDEGRGLRAVPLAL